jgi:hypothetical protein
MSFLLLFVSSLQQNWRKGQNRFCLEARRVGRKGQGRGGRTDPNNVCTYEYMNEEKFLKKHMPKKPLYPKKVLRNYNFFTSCHYAVSLKFKGDPLNPIFFFCAYATFL